MPIYEYQCNSCGLVFERLELCIMEVPTSQCPCGGEGHKRMTSPAVVYEYLTKATHRLPDWDKKMAQARRMDERTLRTMAPLLGDKGKDIRTYEFNFDKAKRDKIEKLAGGMGETYG